jgi:short-subunit dehydrogenase
VVGAAGAALDALLAFVATALVVTARRVDRLEARAQQMAERIARLEGRADESRP